jgi:FkbM family methyltransferase
VPDDLLVSYAQNGEDIVLWRALRHVSEGTYVDVGGWDPDVDSVTRLFYEHGWRGVDVEPVPEFAEKFKVRRPGNEVVQAVITDEPSESVVLHRIGTTGLSTLDDAIDARHDQAGFEHEDITVPARRLDDVLDSSAVVGDTIHFMKVDVEGAEANVLRSVDLRRRRPWVLVIEATEPNSTTHSHASWEPMLLEAGYTFTLFDGLSRFYVSAEHPELIEALSYPACSLDAFHTAREVELFGKASALEQELQGARDEATRWRQVADDARSETEQVRSQLTRVRRRLDKARADRKQLRAQRKRLRAQRKRLRARTKRMAERLEELEQRERARAASVGGRLRATVRRARRH